MLGSCARMFPWMEGKIQLLEGLALFSQIVGSTMTNHLAVKNSVNVSLANSPQWKSKLNCF
jgi:hypothetical protein